MIRSIHTAPQMDSASPNALNVYPAFDYTPLEADISHQVKTIVQRIRHRVKQTLEDLIAVGNDLIAAKRVLPHGRFIPWLRAEFGWAERTARNCMNVAQRFGAKTAIIADLRIDPTAAYLLAAPSSPEEASTAALERAAHGERITPSVAKEILDTLRRKPARQTARNSRILEGKLFGQLLESLECLRQHWHPCQYSLFARQLREFADSLEEE